MTLLASNGSKNTPPSGGGDFSENSPDARAFQLTTRLFDRDSDLNLDCILDSLQSLYFEIKNSNIKSTGYEYYSRKFENAINYIHQSRVNIDDFEHLKLLGQGGFGKVELVRHKHTSKIYAMKSMNKSLLLRSNQSAFFLEERHIMALSNNPWLVKLHYAFIAKDDIYMVMDFMQGGDLINLMSSYDLPIGWAKFYSAEAAIAINALHEFGFIHLDVKPDNMLLDNTGHLKLCDFGTCVNVRKNGVFTCNFAVGTPDYISPEMLSSHNEPTEITKATDWWSYAVFLYELLFEETPFASDSLIGTYTKIANFKSSLKFPDETKTLKPACNLISKLLVDADERPGFDQIKNDLFFLNDEWNFDNIRSCTAVFVPEIKGDEDTTNFDVCESADVSGITPSDGSKSAPYSRVGGDHLNFVGFSFNPSLHNVEKYFGTGNQQPKSSVLPQIKKPKSTTEEFVEVEIDEFKEKLTSYKKMLYEIETQNKALSQSKNDISIQLQNVQFQLQQASKNNQELQTQLELQLTKDNQNHSQIQEYVSQISNLTGQIDAEREKCRQLENEKVQFELRYNDFEHNSMTLKKNFGGVEKKLLQLQFKYEKTLAEMDRLSSELQQERQRNECLKSLTIESKTKTPLDSPTTSNSNLFKQARSASETPPALANRTALLRKMDQSNENSQPGLPKIEVNSEKSVDNIYLKTELKQLKELLKQSTENECKIKNDLRLVTNENERMKQELQQTLDNIRNNAEFVELEHKSKSLESYVNLYKKQVKDLSARVDSLKTDCNDSKVALEKQTQKSSQLESDLSSLNLKYLTEVTKNRDLFQELELNKSNHTLQLSELQNQHTTTLAELETTRKNLHAQENRVIDLTKNLASLSIGSEKKATVSSQSTTKSVSSNIFKGKIVGPDDTVNWKQMFDLEKMKKDQAIKKLDEMIFLFNKKGKTIKPVVNAAATQESKTAKKLQMELRNERLRYERLMVEKQSALFEYNETLARLETKITKLKMRNDQLQSYIKAATNKCSFTSMSSTFGNVYPTESDEQDPKNKQPQVNIVSHDDVSRLSNAQHLMDHSAADLGSENDPFHSVLSTTDDFRGGGISNRSASLTTKPNTHYEGYIWLVPFNKSKRSTRKLQWKKYYAVLTLTHFIVYTEKVEKENSKKMFKKIAIEHIRQASLVTHSDFRKADPKDIPKIFSIKFYDHELVNVTTKVETKSRVDKKCSDPPNISDLKGHNLVATDTDSQPFCGACSLNLSININGEHLHRCYVCRLCDQKFHFFHVSSNDGNISECSKIPANVGALHNKNCLNDNFVVEMFILTASSDECSKWLYSFNNLALIGMSVQDITDKSSQNKFHRDSDGTGSSKIKKKSSLILRLSPSKTKGYSAS